MRTAREFHPSEKLYAKKSIKYSGRLYNRGDEFPSRDVTNKKLLKLFQNGFLGHSEDFRDNKASIKEVTIESEPEVTTEQSVQEEPKKEEAVKPKTSRRGRRKKTED